MTNFIFDERIDNLLLQMMDNDGETFYKVYNEMTEEQIFSNALDPYNLIPQFKKFVEENNINLNQPVIAYLADLNEFLDLSSAVLHPDFLINMGYDSIARLQNISVFKFSERGKYFKDDGDFEETEMIFNISSPKKEEGQIIKLDDDTEVKLISVNADEIFESLDKGINKEN